MKTSLRFHHCKWADSQAIFCIATQWTHHQASSPPSPYDLSFELIKSTYEKRSFCVFYRNGTSHQNIIKITFSHNKMFMSHLLSPFALFLFSPPHRPT